MPSTTTLPRGVAAGAGPELAGEAGEAEPGLDRTPHACPIASHGIALAAAGWHIVEVRPSGTDALALWRVTIERYDRVMTMTLRDAIRPEVAIEELLRYGELDAS